MYLSTVKTSKIPTVGPSALLHSSCLTQFSPTPYQPIKNPWPLPTSFPVRTQVGVWWAAQVDCSHNPNIPLRPNPGRQLPYSVHCRSRLLGRTIISQRDSGVRDKTARKRHDRRFRIPRRRMWGESSTRDGLAKAPASTVNLISRYHLFIFNAGAPSSMTVDTAVWRLWGSTMRDTPGIHRFG